MQRNVVKDRSQDISVKERKDGKVKKKKKKHKKERKRRRSASSESDGTRSRDRKNDSARSKSPPAKVFFYLLCISSGRM